MVPHIELHAHSTSSDGRFSRKELIARAYAAGIRILAITDHDFAEDLTDLRAYAASTHMDDLVIIQGCEFSAMYIAENGTEHELHILGLGFHLDNQIKNLLSRHQPDRKKHINMILQRLKCECGINLGSYEEISMRFPNQYVGRMILASLLVEKAITSSIDESFDLYLGTRGRAYVPSPIKYSSLEEVVRTIIQSGGIPIIAHPKLYNFDNCENERLVRTFKALVDTHGGLGGIEVYHSKCKEQSEQQYLLQLAQKYGLLISGGSDFHGQDPCETLDHKLPATTCAALLEHLNINVNIINE